MIRMLPLVLAMALAACSKEHAASASTNPSVGQPPAASATQPAPEPPSQPVPAELPEVIARVNGEVIDKEEFQKAIRNVEQRAGAPVPADQRDRIFRGVLDQLIAYHLLTQETVARKIDVPEAEVEARMTAMQQQFPSADAFKQELVKQKLTVEELRDSARSDMRVAKMLEQEVNTKVAVQLQDVTDFYEKNPDKFRQGERVRASHILIRTPEKVDEKTKEAARAKAAAVLAQVKAGEDFAALAKQHSQDPGSAPNGGDLGYFVQGQMVGAFERAAFALQPGQVSDLVETPFGFHIIKVADKQAERTVSLEEVRPQIEQFLQNQQRQERTQAFIDALKAKGKIQILL